MSQYALDGMVQFRQTGGKEVFNKMMTSYGNGGELCNYAVVD